jgi:MFS family permease
MMKADAVIAITAVGSFFAKHRALALGIIVSGSSIGGVILPILVTHLIPRIGFGWAMRVVAFLLLFLLVIGNMTITTRLPPSKKKFSVKEFILPFREKAFVLLTASSWFIYFGGFLPFTFIVASARTEGMSAALASYLVAIVNGASYVSYFPRPFKCNLLIDAKQYVRPHPPCAPQRHPRRLQHLHPYNPPVRHLRARHLVARTLQRTAHRLRSSLRLRLRLHIQHRSCHGR